MNTSIPQGICVLVDGGCLNNNKPVTERHMYASLKVYYNGKPVDSTFDNGNYDTDHYDVDTRPQHRWELGLTEDGDGSNQLAELMAMEYALTYAYQLSGREHRVTAITIISDSNYALGWGSGSFNGNRGTSERVLGYGRTFKSLRSMLQHKGVAVEFQHVPESWVKTQLGH